MFDPILSAYKSDEEDFWWIGGPNPCGFLPVEVSFSFSWNSILFYFVFLGGSPVPFSFTQRAGILAIIAC